MMLEEMLGRNQEFVRAKGYQRHMAGKYPRRKLAIVSCMDARLTHLLPEALGLKNGDVILIKTAGAVISDPFGSVIRSLLVAVYSLGVEEIWVIGHHDCGVQHLNWPDMEQKMYQRGISKETISHLKFCGIDLERWLTGCEDIHALVSASVKALREHVLLPKDIRVSGLIIDPVTGELERV